MDTKLPFAHRATPLNAILSWTVCGSTGHWKDRNKHIFEPEVERRMMQSGAIVVFVCVCVRSTCLRKILYGHDTTTVNMPLRM